MLSAFKALEARLSELRAQEALKGGGSQNGLRNARRSWKLRSLLSTRLFRVWFLTTKQLANTIENLRTQRIKSSSARETNAV